MYMYTTSHKILGADFDTAIEVFGCEAVVFKPEIHRNGKMVIVYKEAMYMGWKKPQNPGRP